MKYIRPLTILVVLIGFWKIIVVFTSVPPYILPPPSSVYLALISRPELFFEHGLTTNSFRFLKNVSYCRNSTILRNLARNLSPTAS